MKKDKIFIKGGCAIIVVLLIISWIYASTNGLPWKIKQTEAAAQVYINNKYPELKYKLSKAHYNSKFGYYSCRVITEGDMPVKFEVFLRGKNNIEDNYIEMKVDAEAKNMIVGLIKDYVPKIAQISVLEDAGANSTKGSYEKYKSYIPAASYPLKIDILWNGDKMPLGVFVDKVIRVREILKNNKIAVCGLYVQDKSNGYAIDLKGTKEGSYELAKDEIIKANIAYKIK